MSGSKKESILKYVPEERIILRDLLLSKDLENIEKRILIINGNKVSDLDIFVEKDDEIIVLPLLKGG